VTARPREDAAEAWLTARLADGRPVAGAVLRTDAAAAGHAWPTVKRAAAAAGARSARSRDERTGRVGDSSWWLEDAVSKLVV